MHLSIFINPSAKKVSTRFLLVALFALVMQRAFAQPAINTFSPASGPVGTAVTISGSGFSSTPANNIVFFGAVKAVVTAASTTSLTAKVPAGATYQPITVTVNGLTGYSSTYFAVTFTGGGKITTTSLGYGGVVDSTGGSTQETDGLGISDLDGDGKTDLVVADRIDNNISIYRNKSTVGKMAYSSATNYATGNYPDDVAVADLNGDGKPDIITANYKANSFSVFKNNSTSGTILFASKQDITTGDMPGPVSVADINGDGKPDLVFANGYLSATLSVLLNTSTGNNISFAPIQNFTISYSTISDIFTGDFDGDNKPDVAVCNYYARSVSVLKNTSSLATVSFSPNQDIAINSPATVSAGDLDGDGKMDLVVTDEELTPTSNMYVCRNTSSGGTISFSTNKFYSNYGSAVATSIGDVDGDGLPDVSALFRNGTFSIFKNNTAAPGNSISFAGRTDFNTIASGKIKMADIDGDGRTDITVSSSYYRMIIYRNTVPEPGITAITPNAAGPGGTVTITGNNFTNAIAVSFGGVPAASFTINSSTSITAVVAGGATGDVVVTNAYGTATFEGFIFEGRPVITSFTPTTGIEGGTVILTGANFTGTTSVSFGGVDAQYFYVPSINTLTAIVGHGASGDIIVTTPYGADTATGFAFIPAPFITSFTPTAATSGTQVTITGQYFTGATAVTFGGVAAASFNVNSETSITATVGDGATGDIAVTGPGGTGTLGGFKILPAIQSFSPRIGGLGTVVTITGTNLQLVAGVTFGNVSALSQNYISPYTMQAVVSNYGATGNVTITAASGAYDTASAPGFIFARPVITSFTPASGAPGVPITIKGKYFTDATTVIMGGQAIVDRDKTTFFGDTVHASFTVLSDTEIVTIVVNRLTETGAVSVQSNYGTGTANGFAFNAVPVITSFSPRAGQQGAVVTVTGSNFNNAPGSNIVYFGTVRGNVTACTQTSVTVTVPAGATSGKISITNAGTQLSGTSSQYFTVTFEKGGLDANSFNAKTDFSTGRVPVKVAVGDLDGDGKADMVVANYGSNTISVFKNTSSKGNVSFAPKIDYKVSWPLGLALSDIDGDGKLDIVVFHSSEALNGDSTHYTGGDIGGDTSDSLSIFRNKSAGGVISFIEQSSTWVEGAISFAITDYFYDGKPDIVFTGAVENYEYFVKNKSTGGDCNMEFYEGSGVTDRFPGPVLADDVNGDGVPDITIHARNFDNDDDAVNTIYPQGRYANSVNYLRWTYGDVQTFDWDYTETPPVYSDMDGDGRLDLVEHLVQTNKGGFGVYRNTTTFPGKLEFDDPYQYYYSIKKASYQRNRLAICDMNGDGKPDVISLILNKDTALHIIQNFSSPGLVLLDKPLAYTTGSTGAYDLTIADIDGDGKPDIIVVDKEANKVSVLLHGVGATLPLHLLNFTGRLVNSKTELQWQTTNETNTAVFSIERSTSGIDFAAIGNEKAAGSTTATQTYRYTDASVLLLAPYYSNVYYRLKIIDADGRFTYSNLVPVQLSKGNMLAVYPNPAKDHIMVTLPQSGKPATVQLTGINGQVLKIVPVAANQAQATIRVQDLAKGAYLVIWSDGVNSQSAKVVVE